MWNKSFRGPTHTPSTVASKQQKKLNIALSSIYQNTNTTSSHSLTYQCLWRLTEDWRLTDITRGRGTRLWTAGIRITGWLHLTVLQQPRMVGPVGLNLKEKLGEKRKKNCSHETQQALLKNYYSWLSQSAEKMWFGKYHSQLSGTVPPAPPTLNCRGTSITMKMDSLIQERAQL